MDDDVFAFVHGLVDFVDLPLRGKGAGRANLDALAALEAGDGGEAAVLGRADDGVEAPLLKAEYADALGFLALLNATAAKDAFAGVADDAGGDVVIGGFGVFAEELRASRAGEVGDVEQFALAVFDAGLAIL